MKSIENYNYNLPKDKIAEFPLEQRDNSKLLIWKDNSIDQDVFKNIHNYLPEGSLMILNNSKVIPARIYFFNKNGAKIEIFCLKPIYPGSYEEVFISKSPVVFEVLIKNKRRWKQKYLEISSDKFHLCVELIEDNKVKFFWKPDNINFGSVLELVGKTPLPPYIKREANERDRLTYQTVYAKKMGSVAAPTAGLHFTDYVFNKLKEKNIKIEYVTLHVGLGTFKPITTEDFTKHKMHSEIVSVNKSVIKSIYNAVKEKRKIIVVGTTSLRTIESLPFLAYNMKYLSKDFVEQEDKNKLSAEQTLEFFLNIGTDIINFHTSLFIYPPFDFAFSDALITNFHLPKSSLLLLVDAFVNGKWREIYDYALENSFRFLSYGDSSLLFR